MQENPLHNSQGICTVCAGFEDGHCFCPCLLQSSTLAFQFISISKQPQVQEAQQRQSLSNIEESSIQEEPAMKETPLTQEASQPHHYQRLKKDNIANKPFAIILKNIYTKITGKGLDEHIKKHYHRKDFFIMILNLMQREGLLKEAFELFAKEMQTFKVKILKDHCEEPKYLQYLVSLIQPHVEAFQSFKEGQIQRSLKIIYNFDHMRKKSKFKESFKLILNLRKLNGLPFATGK